MDGTYWDLWRQADLKEKKKSLLNKVKLVAWLINIRCCICSYCETTYVWSASHQQNLLLNSFSHLQIIQTVEKVDKLPWFDPNCQNLLQMEETLHQHFLVFLVYISSNLQITRLVTQCINTDKKWCNAFITLYWIDNNSWLPNIIDCSLFGTCVCIRAQGGGWVGEEINVCFCVKKPQLL